MTSTDINKVLPNTEAMRDALELLNELKNDQFSSMVERVLQSLISEAQSSIKSVIQNSNKQSAAQEAAIRFIINQLTYLSINKLQSVVDALSEPVTSAASAEATTLNEDKIQTLANLWVEKGKEIVQLARTSVIRKVCAGTNAATATIVSGGVTSTLATSSQSEPRIHCSTSIKMGEGSVVEISPSTPEGHAKVQRAAQSADFIPLAMLTLPGGATVEMTEDQAYELFSELDAIQREMDSLFSTGA